MRAPSFLRLCLVLIAALWASVASADRIKDLASVAGVRSNQLVGYGLVVGLSGTGDGDLGITLQSLQSMVSRFGMVAEQDALDGVNAAAVIVTADLPAFVKPGQELDVTVSTLGSAESLRGGTLLMTPLLGVDGETYAIAQGNLVVGGLGVSGEDGSSLTVNVPTVGRVPQGATVERMVENPFITGEYLVLNLHRADFSTAANVAEAINVVFGGETAVPIDASSIRVLAPTDPSQKVSFASLIEQVEVQPAAPPAQVIVNSRTGTVVIGGNVSVTPAVITHGSLTVRIREDAQVTPTSETIINDNTIINTPAAPIITPDTGLIVDEPEARAFLFDPGVNLSDVVDAINAIGATPSDLVAILEALKVAGALRAQLIII
ncbi:flagellar basal body P-ring protein FlgI [Thalassobacter stenotrophicus]|uniref:Flagellar P-ring protein n=2 Tax=Thalassobacter stenotrophicus TaxID=266809 RepID=A0A0P1EYA3_9RHOB|nr:flagellar basal body P-ring protein FlgI [Thalassobacter stenotrophicus]CUH59912.1 Basal body P-ring protein [Thalassobacter stenotrophicus]SHJ17515.1 flagellar P-ring protein precursor FlgI [Thalassobacter stenotrophicus DSM 16310]